MFRTAGLRAVALASALAAALVLVGATAAGAEDGGNSANAHLCQEGGWQDLTTADREGFANPGECVAYAAQGGTLQPKLTPLQQFQALCEEGGGRFVTYDRYGFVIWECDFRGPDPSLDTQAALAAICGEAGGRFIYLPSGANQGTDRIYCYIPTSS